MISNHFTLGIQSVLACLLVVQFVVVVLHDWVEIPGWSHGRQVQAVIGKRRLWIATLINAIFPGIAVVLAWRFWNRPAPYATRAYWIVYCAVTLASAILMWYVPYFLGAREETRRDYLKMYEGTIQVLPRRGDNPRPNLLHACFHVLFVVNLGLAITAAY